MNFGVTLCNVFIAKYEAAWMEKAYQSNWIKCPGYNSMPDA